MRATVLMGASALLLVFVSAVRAQTGAPWELADPNAKVLMGIDIRGLRESAVGKLFGPQVEAKGGATPAMPFHIPGIELLNDIDSVFISSTADAAAPKPAPAKTATP